MSVAPLYCPSLAFLQAAAESTDINHDDDTCRLLIYSIAQWHCFHVISMQTSGQYVDQWPIRRVQFRCPAATWQNTTIGGQDPFPLPDFVPQNSTPVDIHPGAALQQSNVLL
jgi:hypothetical protein